MYIFAIFAIFAIFVQFILDKPLLASYDKNRYCT